MLWYRRNILMRAWHPYAWCERTLLPDLLRRSRRSSDPPLQFPRDSTLSLVDSTTATLRMLRLTCWEQSFVTVSTATTVLVVSQKSKHISGWMILLVTSDVESLQVEQMSSGGPA